MFLFIFNIKLTSVPIIPGFFPNCFPHMHYRELSPAPEARQQCNELKAISTVQHRALVEGAGIFTWEVCIVQCWVTVKEDWRTDDKVITALKKDTPAKPLFDVTEYEVHRLKTQPHSMLMLLVEFFIMWQYAVHTHTFKQKYHTSRTAYKCVNEFVMCASVCDYCVVKRERDGAWHRHTSDLTLDFYLNT